MDCKLGTVVADDRGNLEQTGAARRAEIQPYIVILILDCHRIRRRVLDVLVGDAVLARRRVDLHR